MTVCGFAKTRAGEAYAWADSEVYLHGSPFGSGIKLVASPAGVVGISTGYDDLCGEFGDRIKGRGRASIAAVMSALPAELRAAKAAKIKRLRDCELSYRTQTTYAIVGWSGGEMRGAMFYESRDFEPVEADAWLSPKVDRVPTSAAEVLAVAQAQIRCLQRNIPSATGLALTIARLNAGQVTQTSVPLLIGDEQAARPPAKPALNSAAESPAHAAAAYRAAEAERMRRYWGFA